LNCRLRLPALLLTLLGTLARQSLAAVRSQAGAWERGLSTFSTRPELESSSPLQQPSRNSKAGARRWIKHVVQFFVLAAVVWGVQRTLLQAIADLDEYPWSRFDAYWPWWLAASAALYLVGLLPMALYWRRALVVLGQRPGMLETARAYYVGHLGKYVPGKALVVILRAGMIRSQRVDTGLAAASVFFETLTMMAVGAALAAVMLAVFLRDGQGLLWLALGLGVLAGVPTWPPVFRRLARWAGVGRSDPALRERLQRIDFRLTLLGWLVMVVGWCFLALSMWAVLRAMGVQGVSLADHWPVYLAAVTLAMVAGFLSLLPGGLGVRDLILAQIMIPYLKSLPAAGSAVVAAYASAILLRLVWLAAELIISGVLYVGIRRKSEPPPA